MNRFRTAAASLVWCVIAGCSFNANGNVTDAVVRVDSNNDGNLPDATLDGAIPDAAPQPFIVDHLGAVEPTLTTANLVIDQATEITSLPLVGTTQTSGGAIAVLYFDTLTVNARLRIGGNSPVLLVGNNIVINATGSIDASAIGTTASILSVSVKRMC